MTRTDDLYRPFHPRRARPVAWGVAAAWLLLMLGLAFLLPVDMRWSDRAGFIVVGLAVAWFMYRQATVAATPTEHGLRVRNLILSRELDWAEIVGVRFGGGAPWVSLDLADGDTLAVMAVQRADGELAVAESRRLATLVARHSATERDD